MHTGNIYLIPNLLGESKPDKVIPVDVVRKINTIRHFLVENEKTARRHLRKIGFESSFDEVQLYPIGKHSNASQFSQYLRPALDGEDMGILSEAGMPGIADPGSAIIALAHEKNLTVVPFVGPSSILLALISSGFNGQAFSFHGYLPKDRKDRIRKIKQLEQSSSRGTQLFMDTPFRNNQVFEDLLAHCAPSTLICVACDITLESEYIVTRTAKDWKKEVPDLHKRPAIFLIGQR